MLWNGSEEDGNDTSVCEGDAGTDCGDGDSDADWDKLCVLSV